MFDGLLGGVEEDVVEVAAVDLVEVRDALGDEVVAPEEDVDELMVKAKQKAKQKAKSLIQRVRL